MKNLLVRFRYERLGESDKPTGIPLSSKRRGTRSRGMSSHSEAGILQRATRHKLSPLLVAIGLVITVLGGLVHAPPGISGDDQPQATPDSEIMHGSSRTGAEPASAPVLLAHTNFTYGGGGGGVWTAVSFSIADDAWRMTPAIGETMYHPDGGAGTFDFNASNEPDFPAFVAFLTNGYDDFMELREWLGPYGGGGAMGQNESRWLLTRPDLAGNAIDLVRLVIHDLRIQPGPYLWSNLTWEVWGHPLPLAFVPPTPMDGAYLLDRDSVNVTVNLTNPGTAVLEWQGQNATMQGSGLLWYLPQTDLRGGHYKYRVWTQNATRTYASAFRTVWIGRGVWSGEEIARGWVPTPQLAFDSSDVPRFVSRFGQTLVYGVRSPGTGWTLSTVDSFPEDIALTTSLAIDPAGVPHISYDKRQWSTTTATDVWYATPNGTGWTTEHIDSVGYLTYTSIAIDPASGRPRIAYYDNATRSLKLATRDATGWTNETVDIVNDPGYAVSLQIDALGHAHVAYGDRDGRLRYARFNGTGWEIESVDPTAWGTWWYGISLRLDAAANPHIAYFNEGGLQYAVRNGTGWDVSSVDRVPARAVSLALDRSGNPRIGYVLFFSMGAGQEVRYAALNGSWSIEVVATNFSLSGASIALNSRGVPAIAYPWYTFANQTTTTGLAFMRRGVPVPKFFVSPPAGGLSTVFEANASGTWDIDDADPSLRVRFDWEDDGIWDTPLTTGRTAQHQYASLGRHTVRMEAVDPAGASATTTQFVYVDGTPPLTTAAATGAIGRGGWFTSAARVSMLATDDLSGVAQTRYRVDAGTWTTYTGPFVLLDGIHTIEFFSTDNAGNAEVTRTATVRVDTTRPTSALVLTGQLGTQNWYSSPVVVQFTSTDSASGVASHLYRIDRGLWFTVTGSVTILAERRHTFEYFAVDAAGNADSVHQVTFGIDRSPPSFTPSSPGVSVSGSAVTVTWNATDPGSGIDRYEISIDDGPYVSVGQNTTASIRLGDGAHTVRVRAFDLAGNTANATVTFHVGVDVVLVGLALGLVIGGVLVASLAILFIRKRSRKPPPTAIESP